MINFKKFLGMLLMLVSILLFISSILFISVSLFNSIKFSINNLSTFIILTISSIISMFLSFKLLNSNKFKFIVGVVLIIFGIVYFIPVIFSLASSKVAFGKDIILSLSTLSIVLSSLGSKMLINNKQSNSL